VLEYGRAEHSKVLQLREGYGSARGSYGQPHYHAGQTESIRPAARR
jgi:hypothetical protein